MIEDPLDLSAADLSAAFRSRALSPVGVAEAALARIEDLNPRVNAFTHLDREGARAAATASEARWRAGEPLSPIDGAPATVKELLAAKGWPLRRCSRATPPDAVSQEDAPTVARLREAGAVLLGKTNSPEFGWKGVTDSPLYGATRNPWDPSKTSGGSSGGAAAAAALGLGLLHLGTDGGGSIRIPAAFCGIFGLKPTFGRVPVWPPSNFGTLSHAGPMTRSAEDGAWLMNVLARPDGRDGHALADDGVDYVAALAGGIDGLRIAVSPTLGFAKVDPEIAAIVAQASAVFATLGARVEIIEDVMADPTDLFRQIWASGAALSVEAFPREARAVMDPGLVALARFGEGLDHMAYVRADHARGVLGAQMMAFHQRFDLLITPAEPIAAFDIDRQVAADGQRDWIDWTPFTFPFNLTGQPAASVPCGLTQAGLPVGLQVVGARHADALVLRACHAFESVRPAARPSLV